MKRELLLRKLGRLFGGSLTGALAVASAHAGIVTLDFNTDPTTSGKITSLVSTEPTSWRQDGGASGAAGDGYLAVTDAKTGQSTTIVFNDLEPGFLAASFIFECDLRMGGGHSNPADGFSVNYASALDELVVAADAGSNPTGPWNGTDGEASLPEEGTRTGLAIGFDTWQSATIGGVQDVVGISVRVNGTLLSQFPVPLRPGNLYPGGTYDAAPYRNLAKTNANYASSMQTGARNTDAIVAAGYGADERQPEFGEADWGLWMAGLNWERFRSEITADGKVKIFWKGVELTPAGGLQTTFAPIPGRVVFGGRTGDNYQAHHVDNVRIETVPASVGLVGSVTGEVFGFAITASDSGTSVVDPNSIQVTLDGASVTPTSITKDAGTTTVRYVGPQPYVSGSEHAVVLTGKDQAGNNLIGSGTSRTYTVPVYVTLPPALAVTGVTTSQRGFNVKNYQLDGISHGTTIGGAESTLRGDLGANVADLSTFTSGVYTEPGVINYEQDAANAGAFNSGATAPNDVPDSLIPGIPGNTSDAATGTDNFAMEFITYLHLDVAGVYTFIFNSDDGFRITSALNPREQLTSVILNQADGGKGTSDITSLVYVAQPGFYPVRIVYFEGGSGASAEFSIQKPGGVRRLVNADNADAVKAYRARTGTVPAAVTYTSRTRDSGASFGPITPLVVDIEDGSAAIDQASVKLLVNGTPVTATVTKTGTKTTATYTPTLANPWASGSTLAVKVQFTDAGGAAYDGSLNVPIVTYKQIPAALATAIGTGATPGMKWRTYQTANGHGTVISGAENVLAGGNGANIADLSAATGGLFDITYVNMDEAGGAVGNFTASATAPQDVQDDLLPGIPGTTGSTDNIAAEALTYLELQPGVYQMVVNSDDGFEVTTGIKSATVAEMKFLSLGLFDAGRGATDTLFTFTVQQAGVYFFRLLWFEGGGGANVEWFTVNANGSRALVNGTQTGSIKAFRTRTVAEPTLPSTSTTLTVTRSAGNITIAWVGAGTVQESTDLKTWADVANSANPFTTSATTGSKFYRVRN